MIPIDDIIHFNKDIPEAAELVAVDLFGKPAFDLCADTVTYVALDEGEDEDDPPTKRVKIVGNFMADVAALLKKAGQDYADTAWQGGGTDSTEPTYRPIYASFSPGNGGSPPEARYTSVFPDGP
jgi:hypothetical protein